MAEKVDTRITTSALNPKNPTPARAQGSSAISTLRISVWVDWLVCTWGAGDRLSFMTDHPFPFFASAAILSFMALNAGVSTRWAGQMNEQLPQTTQSMMSFSAAAFMSPASHMYLSLKGTRPMGQASTHRPQRMQGDSSSSAVSLAQ